MNLLKIEVTDGQEGLEDTDVPAIRVCSSYYDGSTARSCSSAAHRALMNCELHYHFSA